MTLRRADYVSALGVAFGSADPRKRPRKNRQARRTLAESANKRVNPAIKVQISQRRRGNFAGLRPSAVGGVIIWRSDRDEYLIVVTTAIRARAIWHGRFSMRIANGSRAAPRHLRFRRS